MSFLSFSRRVAKRASSLSCLALALVLLGGCSFASIIQDNSNISTPENTARKAEASAHASARPPSAAPIAAPVGSNALPATRGAKVALLLPLSGKSAALGQTMAQAAGLAVFDIGTTGFELISRDTKGTPEGAAQAAREALAMGAELLIGPLFAGDVVAVKPVVKAAKVSMLALSTDVSLAEEGAYVLGFAPTPQVERVVTYAASQGARRFGLITAPGAYGEIVTTAFTQAVEKAGGHIVVQTEPSALAVLAERKENLDALFIPFGGTGLKTLLADLAALGFPDGRVRLLGTGLWDEPRLGQDTPALQGAWFAAAPPAARERFVQAYEASYGQTPLRLATLAYDATALAAVLARRGLPYTPLTLTAPAGFAGLDGAFRLHPNGQVERALAILELTDGENRVVDPAPPSFY